MKRININILLFHILIFIDGIICIISGSGFYLDQDPVSQKCMDPDLFFFFREAGSESTKNMINKEYYDDEIQVQNLFKNIF